MTFDIQKAKAHFRARCERRRAGLRQLFLDASADAKCIIDMLIARHHPRRIYQWGSLLHPDRFREWSDIDIAVEGLQGALDGLRAMDDAGSLTRFPVDLVELERMHPEHARTIREEGVLVYDREAS